MSLLHPSSAGAPVTLWFSNGVPVRLVHGGIRLRITSAERVADGWAVSARHTAGRLAEFTIVASGSGWQLRSAG